MKICFFGLGSIGKKHLFNLKKVLNKKGITYEIHAYRSIKNNLEKEVQDIISKEFYSYEELENDYDIIFITNPTSLHYEIMELMKEKTKHMFIEKPIFESIDYNVENFFLKNGIYYVAAPLRYTGIVEKLKEIIYKNNVYSVRAICSSYLPDWRVNQDYRETYSAKKSLGGGVSIDLIHEWDYLTYLFGFPEKIYNFSGKYSHLEIDSEDISIYIAKYNDKLIELHLDYFGRKIKREIEIYMEKGTVIGDFINKEVRFSWSKEKINFLEKDIYLKEMEYFFELIENKKENNNTIENAYKVLDLILRG